MCLTQRGGRVFFLEGHNQVQYRRGCGFRPIANRRIFRYTFVTDLKIAGEKPMKVEIFRLRMLNAVALQVGM